MNNDQRVLSEIFKRTTTTAATPQPTSTLPAGYSNVDGGILGCNKATDMGNANNYVDLNGMNSAAEFFCQRQVDAKVKWEGKLDSIKGHTELHYNNFTNDPVFVSMSWKNGDNCPVLDFTKDGPREKCVANYGSIINTCKSAHRKLLGANRSLTIVYYRRPVQPQRLRALEARRAVRKGLRLLADRARLVQCG